MHSIKVSHTHSFNPSQFRLLISTKISVISIRERVETRRNRSFNCEGMNNSRILASNKIQCTSGLENLPSQNCWESLWEIQVNLLRCRISIMGIECIPPFLKTCNWKTQQRWKQLSQTLAWHHPCLSFGRRLRWVYLMQPDRLLALSYHPGALIESPALTY